MSELGNRPVGSTLMFQFNTAINGVPTDVTSVACSVYKNNTTASTAGITVTQPYNSTTGMAHVVIDTSADGTFYAVGNDFSVVITTGTLGGVSMVGCVVGSFRLSNEDTMLDATTGAIPSGTVTTGASPTSVPTSALSINGVAATGVVADQFKGRVVLFNGNTTTAGLRGSAAAITANTASNTPTFTVGTLPATPASGDTFTII